MYFEDDHWSTDSETGDPDKAEKVREKELDVLRMVKINRRHDKHSQWWKDFNYEKIERKHLRDNMTCPCCTCLAYNYIHSGKSLPGRLRFPSTRYTDRLRRRRCCSYFSRLQHSNPPLPKRSIRLRGLRYCIIRR